jgi:hypothetical protein
MLGHCCSIAAQVLKKEDGALTLWHLWCCLKFFTFANTSGHEKGFVTKLEVVEREGTRTTHCM